MLENADNSYAGTPSHLHVLRRVSDVDAGAGLETQLANGKLKLQGMRLAVGDLVTEDTHAKKMLQPKCANLRANPQAAAAAD